MDSNRFESAAAAQGGSAVKPALDAHAAIAKPAAAADSVSLVLPMFNEADVVEQTLSLALRSLENNFTEFEIVVVDDGSTDDCAARVARWSARDPRIVLLRLERNERFGGALRRGLKAATKQWIFYTDFDLPIELDYLPEILKELRHTDMITGYSPEVPKNLEWNTKLLSVGYNGLVRAAFHLPLRDVNFGFKAMSRSVRDQLQLTSRSPFVDAEMFIQANRCGRSIREVPVPFLRRQMGVSRIRRLDVVLWTLFDMARVWLRPGGKPRPKTAREAAETRVREKTT